MTKKQSKIIKGTAILCMIFHHLFYRIERFDQYGFTGVIGNSKLTNSIAYDMKVCVALFVFVSGYGMLAGLRSYMEKNESLNASYFERSAVRQYLNLIKDTIFLLCILIPVSVLLKLPKLPDNVWGESTGSIIAGCLTNALGIATAFRLSWFINSWWYLFIAVLFIILFPAIYFIYRRCGAVFVLFISIILIPYVLNLDMSNDTFWRYLPAFLIGMIAADKRLFEKCKEWIDSGIKGRKIVSALILLALLALLVFVKHHTSGYNYVIHALQALVVSSAIVFLPQDIPFFSRCMEVLGDNSKYMWLIHVWIYGQLFNGMLFELKNIWLIFASLVVISLIISIVLKFICDRIIGFFIKAFGEKDAPLDRVKA